MESLLQDMRYGFRMLRKSPGFTAVAVLTLALGIAANTSLFSIVNAVLLNPLPFPHPEQLVALHESKPNFERGSISYPNFLDWQRANHSFSSMAIARAYSFTLTGAGDAERVSARFISVDFFRQLGVNAVIGRTFESGEDRIGGAPLALISGGLWQRKFASAPDVLGKSITLDGKGYTVVGVTPASFRLRLPGFQDSEVYVPIGQWNNPLLPNRASGLGIHGIGRLKPGVTLQQAQADMQAVTRSLAATFPDADKGIGATIIPLKQQMVGDVQPVLLLLLAAVVFVLLIACVNVANLLLARSSERSREFAVRAALGASRPRVIRQLLAESVLLAIVGAALGLLLAAWGTHAGLRLLPATLPRAEEISVDARVLLFTLVISLLAAVFFGLAPALKMSQPDLHDTLKQGGRGASGAQHRAQGVFVVVEFALALVLLVGAGLLIRSLMRLWTLDPGFSPHNVLSFGLSLPPSSQTASPDALRAQFRQLHDALKSTPGVQAASLTWGAIPLDSDDEQLFWPEDRPKPTAANDMNWAIDYIVGPEYLRVMGIPLQRGRFFTPQDDEHSPLVVAVDDVFAQKYFPHQDPIGKRIHLDNFGGPLAEIVGVVGHVRQWGLDADDTQSLRAQFYLPSMQVPDAFMRLTPTGTVVLVRAAGPLSGVLDAIRHTSNAISREQVIFDVRTLDEIVSDSLAGRRFSMILLGCFAALALLLAAIGIYGVISYVVGQRTHEMGIRMAMGARPLDILKLVLGDGGKLAVMGVALGLASAAGLTRLMASQLYGVGATDALTFTAVAALLTVVALAACYLPARRATKVDPLLALRDE